MDNPTRSKRTRDAIVDAALQVIARDGANRLTLDAIVKESGMSKGAMMHHFRSKEAVLEAVVERHIEEADRFEREVEAGEDMPEPHLASQIAVLRDVLAKRKPVAFAIVGALAQDPSLLERTKQSTAGKLALLQAEAPDADIATIRWAAARGLAVTALLGMCPLAEDERERMFDLLLDTAYWARISGTDTKSTPATTEGDPAAKAKPDRKKAAKKPGKNKTD